VADGEARWRFFEGGGAVEAEGLTDGRPEESSLVSTWRSGGGGVKGTSAVLVEVKVASKVNRSGSVTRGPRRWVDDVD
jgi:hypothetical protein